VTELILHQLDVARQGVKRVTGSVAQIVLAQHIVRQAVVGAEPPPAIANRWVRYGQERGVGAVPDQAVAFGRLSAFSGLVALVLQRLPAERRHSDL